MLTDEIIEYVSISNKFVPHFHIPLQSGSDVILKEMNRRYLTKLYRSRIEKIRRLIPDCCVGVDVITGFPGEDRDEFLTTYNFLNELEVSYLHVFTYSERPNTLAISMEEVVPPKERNERSKMLRSLSEKKKRHFYESHLKRDFTVLFEDDIEDGLMHGFTENYIRVAAKYDPLLINETKTVHLKSINSRGHVEVNEPDFEALEISH